MRIDYLKRSTIAKRFSGSIIYQIDNFFYLLYPDNSKICLLGKKLPDQSIGMLIQPSFPGMIRICKITRYSQNSRKFFMLSKFFPIDRSDYPRSLCHFPNDQSPFFDWLFQDALLCQLALESFPAKTFCFLASFSAVALASVSFGRFPSLNNLSKLTYK
jgi:hypothetical protein